MKKLTHHPCILPWLFLTAIFSLFSSSRSQFQHGQTHLHFVLNATEFPSEEYYDYIVVGGGTAGCPLAATLSENTRVLVLERGGLPDESPNLLTEKGFLSALTDVDLHNSPAQTFTSTDGVPNARGRVLGGGSVINAGFYSRADPIFYSRSGINWDIRVVNQSYEWVERAIVFQPELKNWQSAVRDGLIEARVEPYNGFTYDHLVGTKIGGSTFDRSGHRHTATDLLSYAKPSNIRVALYASVERILMSGTSSYTSSGARKSAIGIVYRDRKGRQHHAMLRDKGEVILSAGALGSPQLLLLSGIGPKRYLYSWKIQPVHHSPFVGEFIYDNPRNGISIVPPMPLDHSLIQVVGITDSGVVVEAASNVVSFPCPAHSSVFIRTSSCTLNLTVATLMTKISGPLSVGSLRLASKDVKVNPKVRFNYFSNPKDLHKCVSGLRRIAVLLRSRAMNDFKFDDWSGGRDFRFVGQGLPFDLSNDKVMGEYCKRTVSTMWHYHGGCVVGKVVDNELKVMGVGALRVVDGSIFSFSPGTNPQATIMMLGRYVGMKILKERMRAIYHPFTFPTKMQPDCIDDLSCQFSSNTDYR